jgi:hypothetical protein
VSFLDVNGLNKFNDYNYNLNQNDTSLNTAHLNNTLGQSELTLSTNLSHNHLTDNKPLNNPVHYNLAGADNNSSLVSNLRPESEFSNGSTVTPFISNLAQSDLSYTFQDMKSINQSISAGDRTVRLTEDTNFSKLNTNTNERQSSIQNTVFSNAGSNLGNKILDVNAGASRKWASFMDGYRLLNNQTTTPTQAQPLISTSPYTKSLSFDKSISEGNDSPLLKGKDESAPNVIFETY